MILWKNFNMWFRLVFLLGIIIIVPVPSKLSPKTALNKCVSLIEYSIECHFKVKEYCTTLIPCFKLLQPVMNHADQSRLLWLEDDAQQDGQIWACKNAFLGLYSEPTIRIWAGSPRKTLPPVTLELTLNKKLSSVLGVDECGLKGWILRASCLKLEIN